MLLSVIIPAYQCQDTIRNTIMNIEQLKEKDREIIIVNDGSTDNTRNICQQLSNIFDDIIYLEQENSGVSVARNNGLNKARGEYILFIDADDSIDIKQMNELLVYVKNNHQIDMFIYGMSFDYYYHGICYRKEKLKYDFDGVIFKDNLINILDELYFHNMISSSCNKIINKNILSDYNIKFNKQMIIYEDLEFSLKCLAYCNDIYITSKCIYHYKQAEDEGNAKRRLKNIDDLVDIINPIEKTLNNIYTINNYKLDKKTINNILTNLYFILFKDKVSVSKMKESNSLGDRYLQWLNQKQIEPSSFLTEQNWQYIKDVSNRKYIKLLFKKYYIYIRHKIAIILKSTISRKEKQYHAK